MVYEKVLKSALDLSPFERAKLVEIVMQSLSEPNLDVEEPWEQEAARRYKNYKKGNTIVHDMSANRCHPYTIQIEKRYAHSANRCSRCEGERRVV